MSKRKQERVEAAIVAEITCPLIVVEWEDAVMDDDPNVKTMIGKTAGWLLEKTKKHSPRHVS